MSCSCRRGSTFKGTWVAATVIAKDDAVYRTESFHAHIGHSKDGTRYKVSERLQAHVLFNISTRSGQLGSALPVRGVGEFAVSV